jgi:hypothetical protein
MADRQPTTSQGKSGLEKRKEWGEITVSNADTFTPGGFKATVSPLNAVFWKKSDGSEITNTHAAGTNVITVTGAGSNVDCVYMVWGYKA